MLGGGNKILGRGSRKKCNRSSYRIVETPKNTNTPFFVHTVSVLGNTIRLIIRS